MLAERRTSGGRPAGSGARGVGSDERPPDVRGDAPVRLARASGQETSRASACHPLRYIHGGWRTVRGTAPDRLVREVRGRQRRSLGDGDANRRTRHHIPTTAFRIQAGGRRIACSADTEFDPELITWLSEADLVIHETGPGIHTPIERLVELPAPLRNRMRLAHFPDQLEVPGGAIEPLEEGRWYAV